MMNEVILETSRRYGNFEVKSFEIEGPLLITSKTFGDERGFFTERFRANEFAKMGLPTFVQENYSRSAFGVLRGLHYQYNEPQGKLVTAVRGRILDVAVDIRSTSPTFGRHALAVLDGAKPEWLWIPPGFAHGFAVLSEDGADVMYKVDNVYNPQGEGAIQWNDPELAIRWPCPPSGPVLSEKDRVAASFATYRKQPKF